MIAVVAGPLAVAVLFGGLAPLLARLLRPRAAVPVLSLGALAVALTSAAAVAAVAVAGLGRTPAVADPLHWSPVVMADGNPYTPFLGALAALVLAVMAVRLSVAALQAGRPLLRAWSTAHGTTAALVVTDDPEPVAYAVPGWPGRVVVSRVLLASLDGPQRRALLAHERAHLRGRDDLHLLLARLAAGINPFLGLVPSALSRACEGRADAAAVRTVGDARVVAGAIAAAALPPAPHARLAAAGADVAERLGVLLAPRRRPLVAPLVPLLLVAVSVACLLWLGHDLDALTDAAQLAGAR